MWTTFISGGRLSHRRAMLPHNEGLEPTASSVRCASASGSGSGLALSRQESLASLAGCKSLPGKGEPPTRIASCVHGGVVVVYTTNKMDEA